MAYSLVLDILGLHRVSLRWVPKTSDRRSISTTARTSAPVFWNSTTRKVITSWIASSLRMKLNSSLWTKNKTAEHAMEEQSSPSSKQFTLQPSDRKLLLTVFRDSQGPNLNIYGEWYQGNKCKLLQHAKKWTEAGNSHEPERKIVMGCCPVTWQCTCFYSTSHHQDNSKTELGSPWEPCPQSRLGPLWFPSIWTPQEGCK